MTVYTLCVISLMRSESDSGLGIQTPAHDPDPTHDRFCLIEKRSRDQEHEHDSSNCRRGRSFPVSATRLVAEGQSDFRFPECALLADPMLQLPDAQGRSQKASRARNSFVGDCFIGGRFLRNGLIARAVRFLQSVLVRVVLWGAVLTGTAPTRLR